MGGFVPGGAPPMFSPGGRPPPPPPGMLGALPPHVQQQLMGMPPHVQHQFLSQHFGAPAGSPGGQGGGPGFASPPPPPQQQAYGSPHAHQDMQPYGHASSPSPSMPPGSQPLNAAGLMAMLGQRPSGKN
ncbi:hypothetical protein FA09DRAFT_327708 [Tilletiopsis washingtonensis]|uniref:Uncharacterized protein n=1 Tax=Tilletiopsis washingtonensis TaxID=58919 RepID=A0A316ZGX4_9BASI|nr:hypothetical protein FA09DRAFT_327708 [Tilletiopsis washingtonensis]PWO01001.1 hypothetical protein FA09DRAFT_327708 [Tilletiopsis washingtonensis]